MMLPTVHLNGTNARDLLEGYTKSISAVRAAMHIVMNNGPNGRDYYPQGPSAMSIAIIEQESRLKRLESVLHELEAIAEHVARHP